MINLNINNIFKLKKNNNNNVPRQVFYFGELQITNQIMKVFRLIYNKIICIDIRPELRTYSISLFIWFYIQFSRVLCHVTTYLFM